MPSRRVIRARVIPMVMFILLTLYFLTTSLSLLLDTSQKDRKFAVEYFPWKRFNLSGIKFGSSSNATNTTNSTSDLSTKLHKGPFKLVQPLDSTNFRNVKVLCWVLTSPSTLYQKASHVNKTWGPRCDVTLYMSTKADPAFPAVALDVQEGRQHLWKKTKAAFKYVYENHFKDADWFMKADDDTYVIVENLRYFLKDKNSSAPLYFGHNFKPLVKQGYMSGGAGYVLSKEALQRFVVNGDHPRCQENYWAEDVGIGSCLEAVGVVAGDSRDSLNRSRFLPLLIDDFVAERFPDWYYRYRMYDTGKGPACCSDYLISCHYVPPSWMHFLDYVVYHLRSAGDDENHTYNIGNNKTLPI